MICLDEGVILINKAPKVWGFSTERFWGDSYLWKDKDRILISLITTREENKGYFRELVKAIEADGFRVAIPTPLGKMQSILEKWGFVPHAEEDAIVYERPALPTEKRNDAL